MNRMRAIGLDACRKGWVVAAADVDPRGRPGTVTLSIVRTFSEALRPGVDRIVVDMPVGLPAAWERGGRAADVAARSLLGPGRGSSVFPAPPRPALALRDFADPRRAALGLTQQSFALLERLREVDAAVGPDSGDPDTGSPAILEAHPEVIFADLNGGDPIGAPKHTEEGRLRRRVLLEGVFGRPIPSVVAPGAAEDDVLDALACLWVAASPREALSALPEGEPPRDQRGLAMRIWRRDAPAVRTQPVRRIPFDVAFVDALLAEMGPMPEVRVVRGAGAANRIGPEGWALAGAQRLQFGDLRLETRRARVIVEVEPAGGVTNLAKWWPLLRHGADGADGVTSLRDRPFLLVHVYYAATREDYLAHRRLWTFLVERMQADLGMCGAGPADWDAGLVLAGPGAPRDPVPEIATLIRQRLGGVGPS